MAISLCGNYNIRKDLFIIVQMQINAMIKADQL